MYKLLILLTFLIFSINIISQQTTSTIGIGNWSNPTIWDNGIPTNQDTAIVNNKINVDQNIKIADLIINDTLINSNFKIKIESNWFNNGMYIDTLGTVEFKKTRLHKLSGVTYFFNLSIKTSDTVRVTDSIFVRNVLRLDKGYLDITTSMLTLMSDSIYSGRIGKSKSGNILGEFIFEKWVNRCNRWSLYGGPFNSTLNNYSAASNEMIYTGFINSDYPTFNWVNAYFYDEDYMNIGTNGLITPDGNYLIPRGIGFWYWNSDTVYSSGSQSIPQQWKVITKGSINFNSTFFFTIKYTNNGNVIKDGWNLIANPYPGTIDWDKKQWGKTNVDNAIYEFNTCTQTYSSYVNGIGTNGGDKLIGPFQGFFIKANANLPILSCTERVIKNNNEPLKSYNNTNNILRIKFKSDDIIIRINESADEEFNKDYDAYKFMNENSKLYSKLYTDTIKYSINSINNYTKSIPIYTLGGGTIYLSGINSWNINYNLYLEDLHTNNLIDLKDANEITFNETNLNFTNRFVLHILDKSLTYIENFENYNIDIISNQEYIIIKSNYNTKPVNIFIYNLLGQSYFNSRLIITKEGYKIRKPNTPIIIRIYNNDINKSIKIF